MKLAQQRRMEQEHREREQYNRIRKEKEELRLQTVYAREEKVLEEKRKRELRLGTLDTVKSWLGVIFGIRLVYIKY